MNAKLALVTVLLLATVFCFVRKQRPATPAEPFLVTSQGAEWEPLIAKLNSTATEIKTFQTNVLVNFPGKVMPKVTGELSFEKDKNFRFLIRSIVGQEMDIGSNASHFWYWSRRMKPSALHYCLHANAAKAGMKSAFNPERMAESLGVGQISVKDAQITQFNRQWLVIQPQTEPDGEKVSLVTLIDPMKVSVKGRYLYNQHEKMTISSEVTEFQTVSNFVVPRKLYISWYEEGIVMEWEFTKTTVNGSIPKSAWEMPSYHNVIDIGK